MSARLHGGRIALVGRARCAIERDFFLRFGIVLDRGDCAQRIFVVRQGEAISGDFFRGMGGIHRRSLHFCGSHDEQKIKCRLFRHLADRSRQISAGGRDRALDQSVTVIADHRDKHARRLDGKAERCKLAGCSQNVTIAIEHGHMRVGIVKAFDQAGSTFFERQVLAVHRHGKKDARLVLNPDHFAARLHSHAQKPGSDANSKRAPVAHRLQRACDRLHLAKHQFAAVEPLVEKIID
ncbi:hypothetical protein D3C71_1186390 [compost metagenome]